MSIKALRDIRRGDQIVTPKGNVTVTSFSINWDEKFNSTKASVETVTVVGTLNGKGVRMTAPSANTVEVA